MDASEVPTDLNTISLESCGISAAARKPLERSGILTVGDLARVGETQVRMTPRLGPDRYREIQDKVAVYGHVMSPYDEVPVLRDRLAHQIRRRVETIPDIIGDTGIRSDQVKARFVNQKMASRIQAYWRGVDSDLTFSGASGVNSDDVPLSSLTMHERITRLLMDHFQELGTKFRALAATNITGLDDEKHGDYDRIRADSSRRASQKTELEAIETKFHDSADLLFRLFSYQKQLATQLDALGLRRVNTAAAVQRLSRDAGGEVASLISQALDEPEEGSDAHHVLNYLKEYLGGTQFDLVGLYYRDGATQGVCGQIFEQSQSAVQRILADTAKTVFPVVKTIQRVLSDVREHAPFPIKIVSNSEEIEQVFKANAQPEKRPSFPAFDLIMENKPFVVITDEAGRFLWAIALFSVPYPYPQRNQVWGNGADYNYRQDHWGDIYTSDPRSIEGVDRGLVIQPDVGWDHTELLTEDWSTVTTDITELVKWRFGLHEHQSRPGRFAMAIGWSDGVVSYHPPGYYREPDDLLQSQDYYWENPESPDFLECTDFMKSFKDDPPTLTSVITERSVL